jgi:hypothetical protein
LRHSLSPWIEVSPESLTRQRPQSGPVRLAGSAFKQ